jgi:hypothetical protein
VRSFIHCAARKLEAELMPSRFPLPWPLENQAERGRHLRTKPNAAIRNQAGG